MVVLTQTQQGPQEAPGGSKEDHNTGRLAGGREAAGKPPGSLREASGRPPGGLREASGRPPGGEKNCKTNGPKTAFSIGD